jgi:hypothetical protein
VPLCEIIEMEPPDTDPVTPELLAKHRLNRNRVAGLSIGQPPEGHNQFRRHSQSIGHALRCLESLEGDVAPSIGGDGDCLRAADWICACSFRSFLNYCGVAAHFGVARGREGNLRSIESGSIQFERPDGSGNRTHLPAP